MPLQGGIREEETPLQAARRELQEETGISSVVKITDVSRLQGLCVTCGTLLLAGPTGLSEGRGTQL